MDDIARKAKFRWKIIVSTLFIVVLSVGGAGGIYLRNILNDFKAEGPLAQDIIDDIHPGMGLSAIAEHLEKTGIIADRFAFRLIVEYQELGDRLQAGNYKFHKGISAEEVLQKITEGRTHKYRITIPEGLSSHQVLQLLQNNRYLKGKLPSSLAEASVHPETYHFEKGMTRQSLLSFMQASWKDKLDELWESRAEGLPFDSKAEALVMASMIEREAVDVKEMPIISGVFKNRLEKGIRLQSDPTVIYALSDGKGKLSRKLLQKDWKFPHAYNTYVIKGLPPGPIAHPSEEALRAALNPAKHAYIFFVADGKGGHRFSMTYAEHKKNVAKLRAVQRK